MRLRHDSREVKQLLPSISDARTTLAAAASKRCHGSDLVTGALDALSSLVAGFASELSGLNAQQRPGVVITKQMDALVEYMLKETVTAARRVVATASAVERTALYFHREALVDMQQEAPPEPPAALTAAPQ